MTYYEESLLQVEWTNQHGCGADHDKVDCEIVLQFMCHPLLRDGVTTETIDEATKDSTDRGMHETFEYYDKCQKRNRNRGLWIADQNRGQNANAKTTRQDNGGTYGFECAEERDYYPYWHPSPWRDIAILTADANRCNYFKTESQNVKGLICAYSHIP